MSKLCLVSFFFFTQSTSPATATATYPCSPPPPFPPGGTGWTTRTAHPVHMHEAAHARARAFRRRRWLSLRFCLAPSPNTRADEETHATRKGCAEIRPVPRSVVSSPPCHSAKAGKPSVDVGPGGASSSGQRARCLTSYKVMVLCSPSVRPPLLASIQHRVKHAHNEGAAYAWHVYRKKK